MATGSLFFQKLPGDIAGYLNSLCDRSPLSDKTGYVFRCRQINSLWQFLDMQSGDLFHSVTKSWGKRQYAGGLIIDKNPAHADPVVGK